MRNLLIIILSLLFTSIVYGQEDYSSKLHNINTYYATQAEKYVKLVDPNAQVHVDLKAKYETVQLPFSGLSSKNLIVSNKNGMPVVESVNIKVFTDYSVLPPSVTENLNTLFAWAEKKPEISVLTAEKLSLWHPDRLKQSLLNPSQVAVFAFLFLVFCMVAWGFAGNKNVGLRLISAIQSAAGELKGAQESSSFQRENDVEKEQELSTEALASLQPQELSNYPVDSLAAILFDCYWSEKDSYAKWLWDQILIPSKKELVANYPELSSYAAYLYKEKPEPGTWHQSSYYLSPLSLESINTSSLKAFVEKSPELFNSLSPLRKSSLKLSPKKVIEWSQLKTVKFDDANKKLGGAPKSTPRVFPPVISIDLHSIEDEVEVLAIEDLPIEVIKEVPSLGWLQKLPEDKSQEILAKYNAMDLAEAWLGPEEVLQFVENQVPSQKMELVSSYREKIQPKRGAVLRSIHSDCIHALQKQQEDRHEEDKLAS